MLMEEGLDVQALRYFVEVARRQGFTRASESLHVTQPAISKAVKALEEELGTPLLLRERRQYLTAIQEAPTRRGSCWSGW